MYDGKPLVQFHLQKPAEVLKVMAELDELECTEMSGYHSTELFAICDAAKVESMKALHGSNMTVLNEDAGGFYRSTSGLPQVFRDGPGVQAADFYSRWRTYETRIAKLKSLVDSC